MGGHNAEDTEHPRRGVPATSAPQQTAGGLAPGGRAPAGLSLRPLARTCIAVLESQPWRSQTWVQFLQLQKLPPELLHQGCWVQGSGGPRETGVRRIACSLQGRTIGREGTQHSNSPPLPLSLSLGCPTLPPGGLWHPGTRLWRSLLFPYPHQPYALGLY